MRNRRRKRLSSKRMNLMSNMSVRISSKRCLSKSSQKARKLPERRFQVVLP